MDGERSLLSGKSEARTGGRSSLAPVLLGAFLFITLLLGGGGRPAFVSETIAILLSLAIAAIWVFLVREEKVASDPLMTAVAAIFVSLPILHLIPLPQFLLDMRGVEPTISGSLAVADATGSMRPLTIDQGRTVAALLSILPPLILWWMLRTQPLRDRLAYGAIILAAVLCSALLAAVQVASGGSIGHIYDTHFGFASGLLANRNSSADFYLIGLCILAVGYSHVKARRRHAKIALPFAAFGILLALATILTGSRTGTVLLLVPAGLFLLLNYSALSRRQILITSGILVLGTIAVMLLASQIPMIERTIARFGLVQEGRYSLWEDARYAIGQVLPWGSGMGTGDIMMKWAENLDSLDPPYPNRVHNDYMEFFLEAGWLAAALLVGFALIAAVRLKSLLFSRDHDQKMAGFLALGLLAIIALHSIVDYPLRSITLSMVAAFAISLLSNSRDDGTRVVPRSKASE